MKILKFKNISILFVSLFISSIAVAGYSGPCVNKESYNLVADIECIFERANSGDANAQFDLGLLYRHGDVVEQNHEKAVKWYSLSAEQGNVNAQINLGYMYTYGFGVEQSDFDAFYWYGKAANQGNTEALYYYGVMHFNGYGVELTTENRMIGFNLILNAARRGNINAQLAMGNIFQHGLIGVHDALKAYRWYRDAANSGSIQGKFNLGVMYFKGLGVEQNYSYAFKLFEDAGFNGHVGSQYNLGLMYEHGVGVEKNKYESEFWYNMSNDNGYEDIIFE